MLVRKAIEFAAHKHKNQKRRSNDLPYIIHPVEVMYLISKYKRDSSSWEELQVAALLHDTLEDTECSFVEIEREFTPMVASIVMELTSDEVMVKKLGKNEYLKQKMVKMSKYAFIIKLLDRMSNIHTHHKKKYLTDTIELMNYLLKNRHSITDRQIEIIEDIISICKKRINNGEIKKYIENQKKY